MDVSSFLSPGQKKTVSDLFDERGKNMAQEARHASGLASVFLSISAPLLLASGVSGTQKWLTGAALGLAALCVIASILFLRKTTVLSQDKIDIFPRKVVLEGKPASPVPRSRAAEAFLHLSRRSLIAAMALLCAAFFA